MKFSSSSTAMFASLALGVARNVAAFGVRPAARSMTTQRAFTSSAKSLNMANVLKLSDPQSQLLDEVDVFIFDCDGVIWRVRRPECFRVALQVARLTHFSVFCFSTGREIH